MDGFSSLPPFKNKMRNKLIKRRGSESFGDGTTDQWERVGWGFWWWQAGQQRKQLTSSDDGCCSDGNGWCAQQKKIDSGGDGLRRCIGSGIVREAEVTKQRSEQRWRRGWWLTAYRSGDMASRVRPEQMRRTGSEFHWLGSDTMLKSWIYSILHAWTYIYSTIRFLNKKTNQT